MKPKLKVIRTNKEVETLLNYLEGKEYCAFDTETDGLEKRAHVIGYSVCCDSNEAFYVITRKWVPFTAYEEVPCTHPEGEGICKLCSDTGFFKRPYLSGRLDPLETNDTAPAVMQALLKLNLIMHNAVFDLDKVLVNYGVDLTPALHTDTMVLAHLLDENRKVGLKQLGTKFYGDDAAAEQKEMIASILSSGGSVTKDHYELYKADPELIGRYGAQDAILTFNLFWEFTGELFEEGLDKFFYEEETMPLLKGPTFDLNTEGLRVDVAALGTLRRTLESEIAVLESEIYDEIKSKVEIKYPLDKTGEPTFNIGSGPQLAWLLYDQLGEIYYRLTPAGDELADSLGHQRAYSDAAKRSLISDLKRERQNQQDILDINPDAVFPKKIRDYWNYISVDEEALKKVAKKYKWVQKLLQYKKLTKLLSTYVIGIEESMQYGVIRPSFLQHGTTSGRYSSRDPNFTNLPREDKRIKSCIVSRPGKVFVGADFEQIEPRIFASLSGDERLLNCFRNGEDFYSVIGMEVYNITDALPLKEGHPDAFGEKYPKYRQISKTIALAATYGATAPRIASIIGIPIREAQEVIDRYFEIFPKVKEFQLACHKAVKQDGRVTSMFGRPRRLPEGVRIAKQYLGLDWMELPYQAKSVLNLAVNFVNQSAAASILNRSMIAFKKMSKSTGIDCKIVLCVHDEIVVECREEDAEYVSIMLKQSMESTCAVPGVALVAIPKIGKSLSELK